MLFFWIEIHKKKEGDCFEELKGGHFVIMVRKPPRYFNKSSCNPSRTPEKRLKPLRRCLFIVLPLIWKTSSNRRKLFPFVDSWVVLAVMPKPKFMELPKVDGLRNPPNSCCTWYVATIYLAYEKISDWSGVQNRVSDCSLKKNSIFILFFFSWKTPNPMLNTRVWMPIIWSSIIFKWTVHLKCAEGLIGII